METKSRKLDGETERVRQRVRERDVDEHFVFDLYVELSFFLISFFLT